MKTKTKVLHDASNCVLCRTCEYVCPANAICITPKDAMHVSYIIWNNSCTLCGNCAYFCPTDALHLEESLAPINKQSDKYITTTASEVTYTTCKTCGQTMVAIPERFLEKGFSRSDIALQALFELCPSCRTHTTFSKRVL